ncbi:uncharacterized protein [Aegilops tauschii subsp. strangulata]|uniref:uncharacterized protein n=1 Tax=Aegilops tauschii subsp. strangulata TaxID=200361 RepID=UPI003CC845D9
MPTFARASFLVIVRPDGRRQNLSLVRSNIALSSVRLSELVSSTKKQHKACQFVQSISVFQFVSSSVHRWDPQSKNTTSVDDCGFIILYEDGSASLLTECWRRQLWRGNCRW